MSTAVAVRHTAQERREEILQAAVVRFGATGLHGTSTELIAADVGVSQPYLFRLFGTKKELFMAAIEWAFDYTVERFREAGRGASDRHEAFRRMGETYMELVRDRRYLAIQLQAYASTDDPEIRAVVQEGFGRLTLEIVRHTDAGPDLRVAACSSTWPGRWASWRPRQAGRPWCVTAASARWRASHPGPLFSAH
jgi:AcrR family transcriptional regulator